MITGRGMAVRITEEEENEGEKEKENERMCRTYNNEKRKPEWHSKM